jgi:hypothetical protein
MCRSFSDRSLVIEWYCTNALKWIECSDVSGVVRYKADARQEGMVMWRTSLEA